MHMQLSMQDKPGGPSRCVVCMRYHTIEYELLPDPDDGTIPLWKRVAQCMSCRATQWNNTKNGQTIVKTSEEIR